MFFVLFLFLFDALLGQGVKMAPLEINTEYYTLAFFESASVHLVKCESGQFISEGTSDFRNSLLLFDTLHV